MALGICPRCEAHGKIETSEGFTICRNGHKFLTDKWKAHNDALPKFPPLQKRTGWQTPYGYIDFNEGQTFEEACKIMRELSERFKNV